MPRDVDRKTKAFELFKEGYNCAQAILALYGEEFRLKREHVPLRSEAGLLTQATSAGRLPAVSR